jgi:hypothetical protein
MPNINISIPHQLPPEQALTRIKDFIAQAKTQYSNEIGNLQENWNGHVGTFSGSARGLSVSGILTVEASVVAVELTIPFAAMLFKGTIESGIRDQLTKLLS